MMMIIIFIIIILLRYVIITGGPLLLHQERVRNNWTLNYPSSQNEDLLRNTRFHYT